jgi:hypothetical protein
MFMPSKPIHPPRRPSSILDMLPEVGNDHTKELVGTHESPTSRESDRV